MMNSCMATLSSPFTGFKSASSWFEVYVAFSAFVMLLRTAFNDLIPEKLRSFILSKLVPFISKTHPNNLVSLRINQIWEEQRGDHNELYCAVSNYLPSRITRTYKALKIGKLKSHKNLMFALDTTQEVVDQFEGTDFTWKFVDDSDKNSVKDEVAYVLRFHEKHRDTAMERYIPHVIKTYEAMKAEQRTIKIFSMSPSHRRENELSHPATFDTLALDPELKQLIVNDLDRFLDRKRKEFYKRVGKPWKRGYLLYGPPGTGKTSLIAAIANYLKFNVYDLELNSVYSNDSLKQLMRGTSPRSIIVIEDIDCNKEVNVRTDRRDYADTDSDHNEASQVVKVDKFTLSGLLNYMDGLWSGFGEERIIIFTTNHKEKIDPALLRPGRMDMHIHLSFLKAKAFRILAFNYLEIKDHPLFEDIEELLEKTNVTPAMVAEQLMRNEDPDVALDELSKFLKEVYMKGQTKPAAED